MKFFYFFTLSISFFAVTLPAQAPVITAVTAISNTVTYRERFEAVLTISTAYNNPYDYDEIRVEAVFTAPSGNSTTVDGFYMEPFQVTNTTTGALQSTGPGGFRVRFSPGEPGIWTYQVRCINAVGTGNFDPQTFECIADNPPANKGMITGSNGHYFTFEDGATYIPIGENIGWANSNPYVKYSEWISKMAENGGNFFRIWNCSWGLALEWKNGNGYQGLKRYRQNNAFYLDWLLDFSAQKGVYVMMCLNHHGQVSTTVNPEWSNNPYNAANGGPCSNTWDFFTHAQARQLHKNRLRYMIARWGSYRSLMAWELFNEIDWTDQFEQRKSSVTNWHSEMASFIQEKDPFEHLVTTSYAHDYNDPATWVLPQMDFTQTHYYLDIPHLERVLATGARSYLDTFSKPVLNGEFGLGGSSNGLAALDPGGIHIHNALWGGLYGGGAGSGMSWWWDTYIDPQNLYGHFQGLRTVSDLSNFSEDLFHPAVATVSGAPADLSLTPALGWGALADTSMTILPDGSLSPANARLSQYLYGAQWNTQYRRPPVFQVNYPQNGIFSVKTGATSGQAPQISIWLDGVLLLQTPAVAQQTYTIDIPAGTHHIKVDNTGTDWVTIAQYVFQGLGSAVDAFVLRSADHAQLSGWVINHAYNHQYVKANGLPDAVSGAMLRVNGLSDGEYSLNWYECMGGTLSQSVTVTVSNGTLEAPIPDLLWDAAFTLGNQMVPTRQAIMPLPFDLCPNPVVHHHITLTFTMANDDPVRIELMDAGGRTVMQSQVTARGEGQHTEHLDMPPHLPSGIYWVKITQGHQTGVKPISMIRD